MIKRETLWLFAALMFAPTRVVALSDEACLKYALYKEARGEGILTMRAVLDVIENRMKATGQSACKVLKQPGQFPYFSDGVKAVDKAFHTKYYFVVGMGRVLGKRYLFFNHVAHPWGKKTKKIGNLYFAQ